MASAQQKFQIISLILFIVSQVRADDQCTWSTAQQMHLNKRNLNLTDQIDMGKFSPAECTTEIQEVQKMRLRFPENVYKENKHLQEDDVIFIVYTTLRHISKIYSKNLQPVSWNKTVLHEFQAAVHSQVEELEKCLMEKVMVSSGDHYLERKVELKLRNYFKLLEKMLAEKENNQCAWRFIRAQVRKFLYRIDQLTAWIGKMKNNQSS
ncbi:interferon a3-like [Latimeria chalumnae]|uniref:interferon a3-like n=1 Tax=Latimeria chalumnae TaxID=7897 RepID=UPI00313BCEC6